MFCPWCRLEQPSAHRFCPRCGGSLPTDLVAAPSRRAAAKAVKYFAGIKVDQRDHEGAYLRVTCYREDRTFDSEEGSVTIPGHHVRFSVWVGDRCTCVLSLPETEARQLAEYLGRELDGLGDVLSSYGIR